MVRDDLVVSILHRRGDEHVERGGDQHRSGEAEQEQQDEVVRHKPEQCMLPENSKRSEKKQLESHLVSNVKSQAQRQGSNPYF
jgi:hypothetical protein